CLQPPHGPKRPTRGERSRDSRRLAPTQRRRGSFCPRVVLREGRHGEGRDSSVQSSTRAEAELCRGQEAPEEIEVGLLSWRCEGEARVHFVNGVHISDRAIRADEQGWRG